MPEKEGKGSGTNEEPGNKGLTVIATSRRICITISRGSGVPKPSDYKLGRYLISIGQHSRYEVLPTDTIGSAFKRRKRVLSKTLTERIDVSYQFLDDQGRAQSCSAPKRTFDSHSREICFCERCATVNCATVYRCYGFTQDPASHCIPTNYIGIFNRSLYTLRFPAFQRAGSARTDGVNLNEQWSNFVSGRLKPFRSSPHFPRKIIKEHLYS